MQARSSPRAIRKRQNTKIDESAIYLGAVSCSCGDTPKRKIDGVLTFTSDVIVGFPTETEEDFEKTLSLVEKVGV